MDNQYLYCIGQGLSFVAVILGFISFQMKSAKGLLLMQIFVATVFSVHYFLIGAMPAAVMNVVGIIRTAVFYFKDKKFYNPKVYPLLFAIIMLGFGIYSWVGWYSIFVVAGLVIHTMCLPMKNPQHIRWSILVTSPMVLIYDIFELSVGGIIYESMVIISSIIGIVRFRKNR